MSNYPFFVVATALFLSNNNFSWCFSVRYSLLVCSDIPMAQFIISYNASLPPSQKFILHVLDNTHIFVQPSMAEMIRSKMAEFRDQNTYEKPAWFPFSYLARQQIVTLNLSVDQSLVICDIVSKHMRYKCWTIGVSVFQFQPN